jgi:hypothetical protein
MIEKNKIQVTKSKDIENDTLLFTAYLPIHARQMVSKTAAEQLSKTLERFDLEKQMEEICVSEIYSYVYGDLYGDVAALLQYAREATEFVPYEYRGRFREDMKKLESIIEHKLRIMKGC